MPRTRAQRIVRFLIQSLLFKSLIVLGLSALAVWGLTHEGTRWMQLIVEQEERLQSMRDHSPIWLFVVGLVVYFVACFVPGTNGKAFLCGWLFGVLAGVVLINLASMLAALVMFFLARHWLRRHIESRYAGHLIGINQLIQRHGGAYVCVLRVVPIVPYSVLNVLMGVTPLPTRTFWWASQLGMLPSNFAFAWAGASLPTLRELQHDGWIGLISWQLVSGLLLLVLLPFVARHMARSLRARRQVQIET